MVEGTEWPPHKSLGHGSSILGKAGIFFLPKMILIIACTQHGDRSDKAVLIPRPKKVHPVAPFIQWYNTVVERCMT